ncbi:MAG: CapA family protein [Lentimicrobiaceae bacterium]|nr:CapA family protein [Lentimicrobiaceae bacterium]
MTNGKLKILFAGDFCTEFPERIEVSTGLKQLFDSCDLKLLNFEGPLAHGKVNSPTGKALPQSKSSPEWCENNGFNIVSLANNHALDYGAEGLQHTRQTFKKSQTIGAGEWEEAYKVKYITVNDIKLGFIAGTSSDFASLKDWWTDYNKMACPWINSTAVNRQINEARDKCDFLFVISHAGLEFMDVPLPEWRDRYRELIDMGADAIIATHPHVPQGTEVYKNKPIIYSLGNFFFDKSEKHRKKYWDNGLLAVIEIENNQLSHHTIPTLRKNFFIDTDNSAEARKHLDDITSVLKNDVAYMKRVNEQVLKFYPMYKTWLLGGFNATEVNFSIKSLRSIAGRLKASLEKPDLKIAMHQMREDSTRWALIRALKIMSNSNL